MCIGGGQGLAAVFERVRRRRWRLAAPLAGVRVIEFASFVAGPSAGLALAQLGAEVIRVDPLGGNVDHRRWPLSEATGASLYWNSLNREKRSVALNLREEAGRDLLLALATAPGPDADSRRQRRRTGLALLRKRWRSGGPT